MITFSDHAALVAPPTLDRTIVLRCAQACPQPGRRELRSPSGRSRRDGRDLRPRPRPHHSPPAVVLVLSDGGQTAARPTPQQAAAGCAKAHVPVSAVAVGTANGVVHQKIAGGYTEQIAVPVESTTLRDDRPGERRARSTTLDVAFRPGRSYAEPRLPGRPRAKGIEVTSAAAGGGIALMLVGAFLGGVWFRRVP